MTRLVLTGPGANLIDAKLDLVYRHMVQLPGGSPFMSTHSLKLVRSEVRLSEFPLWPLHFCFSHAYVNPGFVDCKSQRVGELSAYGLSDSS